MELCFKCGRIIRDKSVRWSSTYYCSDCYQEFLNKYRGRSIIDLYLPKYFYLLLKKKNLRFLYRQDGQTALKIFYLRNFYLQGKCTS